MISVSQLSAPRDQHIKYDRVRVIERPDHTTRGPGEVDEVFVFINPFTHSCSILSFFFYSYFVFINRKKLFCLVYVFSVREKVDGTRRPICVAQVSRALHGHQLGASSFWQLTRLKPTNSRAEAAQVAVAEPAAVLPPDGVRVDAASSARAAPFRACVRRSFHRGYLCARQLPRSLPAGRAVTFTAFGVPAEALPRRLVGGPKRTRGLSGFRPLPLLSFWCVGVVAKAR